LAIAARKIGINLESFFRRGRWRKIIYDPALAREALSFSLILVGPFDGVAARDLVGVALAMAMDFIAVAVAMLVSCC